LAQKVSNCEKPILGVLIGFGLAGTVIMAEQASEQHRGMTRGMMQGMMQEPKSGEQSQDNARARLLPWCPAG
jgi:hypothetical protein